MQKDSVSAKYLSSCNSLDTKPAPLQALRVFLFLRAADQFRKAIFS